MWSVHGSFLLSRNLSSSLPPLPVISEFCPAAEHPTGAKIEMFLFIIIVDARVRAKILFLQVHGTAAAWDLEVRGFQSCISQNCVVAMSWSLRVHRTCSECCFSWFLLYVFGILFTHFLLQVHTGHLLGTSIWISKHLQLWLSSCCSDFPFLPMKQNSSNHLFSHR